MSSTKLFFFAAMATGMILLSGPVFADDCYDDCDPDETIVDLVDKGRSIFRHDTLGNEAFWGGQLELHKTIAGDANGGIGGGISPAVALELGLRVDANQLPSRLKRNLQAGRVDLDDPATTLDLLRLDAVVGLKGFFGPDDTITGVGFTCALCHSRVDDSFAPGIGELLDGWPNRELEVGKIIAAAPNLSYYLDTVNKTRTPSDEVNDRALRTVLAGPQDPPAPNACLDPDAGAECCTGWGQGKLDAFFTLDGKGLDFPDCNSAATQIPPLFGLNGVGLVTWNGWNGLSGWMPVVINLVLHGQGTLSDASLNDAERFPVAAANEFARVPPRTQLNPGPDLVTSKLGALEAYILALKTPEPPAGSFDSQAAERGEAIFLSKCSGCHVPPIYTRPGRNLVPASLIGIQPLVHLGQKPGVRIPPLRGIFTRQWENSNGQKVGGFFHDARFESVRDVIDHFNAIWGLELGEDDKADLVEFVKSL